MDLVAIDEEVINPILRNLKQNLSRSLSQIDVGITNNLHNHYNHSSNNSNNKEDEHKSHTKSKKSETLKDKFYNPYRHTVEDKEFELQQINNDNQHSNRKVNFSINDTANSNAMNKSDKISPIYRKIINNLSYNNKNDINKIIKDNTNQNLKKTIVDTLYQINERKNEDEILQERMNNINCMSNSSNKSLNNESYYNGFSVSENEGINPNNIEKLRSSLVDKVTLTDLQANYQSTQRNNIFHDDDANKDKITFKNSSHFVKESSISISSPNKSEWEVTDDNDIAIKFKNITQEMANQKLPQVNLYEHNNLMNEISETPNLPKIDRLEGTQNPFKSNTNENIKNNNLNNNFNSVENEHVFDQFNETHNNEEKAILKKYNNNINEFINSLVKLCNINMSVVEWINKSYTWIEDRYLSEYIKDKENADDGNHNINKPTM